ncbi:MAG: hypothetical protein QNJ54_06950 [Prochloraceae cyanobacterium]|nr:hypothetical protein [Prochloraceae cyanobacterium]
MSPTTNLDSIKKPIKKTKAYKAIGKNINYRSVKGYPNTQNIAVNLAAQVFLAEEYVRRGLPQEFAKTAESNPAQILLYAAKKVERELTPCYWLASELSESLKVTDIPDNWSGLKPFVNRGIFLLPKNCLEYSEFGENEGIDWLYFEVLTALENLNISKFSPGDTTILWCSSSERLSIFYGTIDLHSQDNSLAIEGQHSKDYKELVEQVNKLLLNTMLVLNYKPDLLEIGESESLGVGFGNLGKLPSSVPRNPVWIGKSYSGVKEYLQREKKLVRDPRAHIRRGHWARRRHGTKEDWQYQWHWIEPTLVNYVE